MAKSYTRYVCTTPGCDTIREIEFKRCPTCGEFGSMKPETVGGKPAVADNHRPRVASTVPSIQRLTDVKQGTFERFGTGMSELDRVLGGGIVSGSIVAIGGSPGAGKSTLLAQVASHVAQTQGDVVYLSGEESPSQVRNRFERVAKVAKNVHMGSETSINKFLLDDLPKATSDPKLLIVDSINMVVDAENSAAINTPSQMKAVAVLLQQYAKSTGVPVIAILHVTKDGDISGPEFLQHVIDATLLLEGDSSAMHRLLRSIKNRFGTTGEVGVFAMQGDGLKDVENPSEIFLAERLQDSPGSAVTVVVEGQRAILLEVQAMCHRTANVNPRRRAEGFSHNRVDSLMTVVSKTFATRDAGGVQFAIDLDAMDVYINVAGGLRVGRDADLAVIMSVISSYIDKPIAKDVALFGEVGYGGEIRTVPLVEMRVREAKAQGYKRVVVPHTANLKGSGIIKARTIVDVCNAVFE